MALNISYNGRERPRLISVPQSEEQMLLSRFPEEGLTYDIATILEATKKAASIRRSGRWQIEYSSNLKQAEILFSRRPKDPNYKRDGIVVRGSELSVYAKLGEDATSTRVVFSNGIMGNEVLNEVKVAAMRALRTLRLAPQLPKTK